MDSTKKGTPTHTVMGVGMKKYSPLALSVAKNSFAPDSKYWVGGAINASVTSVIQGGFRIIFMEGVNFLIPFMFFFLSIGFEYPTSFLLTKARP